jgi:hypothetical protein
MTGYKLHDRGLCPEIGREIPLRHNFVQSSSELHSPPTPPHPMGTSGKAAGACNH